MDLCTEFIFFEENWIFSVRAVELRIFTSKLSDVNLKDFHSNCVTSFCVFVGVLRNFSVSFVFC